MAGGKSMFDSIKSKLGIDKTNDAQLDNYEEYEEYEEYDDYDTYDDGAYYDQGEEDYDDYGYGSRHKVTTRNVGSSLPRLVTREDAQESTRSNSSFGRESFASSSLGGSRTMVDSSLPVSMTPEGTSAISAAGNRRAEGLDSLFGSTRPEARSTSFDPKGSSGPSAASTFAGKRNLQVIKPSRYDDAEGVTRALKLGNVAVLVLSNASDALARRILDFAFGATSALDGGVEAIGPKTYALTTQAGLTEQEKSELANLGVI